MDIEKILQGDDADALGRLLDNHAERRKWKGVLRDIEGKRAPADIFLRGVAEERLVELNQGRRWVPFMEAREEGATWDEIAAAANHETGESARVWYADRLATVDPPLSDAEMARARAVIDDQAADAPAAEKSGVDAVVDDPPAHGEQ